MSKIKGIARVKIKCELKFAFCITTLFLILTMSTVTWATAVEGQVRDALKGPNYEKFLSGVTVFAKGQPTVKTVTDSNGKYNLPNVAENEEFIVFEKDGYVKDMKRIQSGGKPTDMALVVEGLTTISDDAFFQDYVNLDFAGMEKVKSAIEKSDYLLAKYEMINYYRERKTPVWNVAAKPPEQWKVDTSYSTVQVDEELAHNVTNSGFLANTDTEPGSGNINWDLVPYGDKEWKWGYNRMFTVLHMGNAWAATLNSKYAYEYMSSLLDWIYDNPMPCYKDNDGTWRTIEVGIRNHYPLPNSWYSTLFNEDITTEARITFLKSNLEHMEYLTKYTGSGNWLIFESRGLYTLAVLHPQFKQSPQWKEIALGRASAQYIGQFRSDGWQFELTPNYHMESTNSITEIEKIAQLNGESTVLREGLKRSYDVENIFSLPGGRAIPANDTGIVNFRDVVRNAAKVVGNYQTKEGEDYILTATDFRAGRAMNETAKLFSDAGYLVLRDFWGPNNMTTFFEAGNSGVGHGVSTRDKLQVVMSANGRDILIDPGVFSYTSVPIAKYMYTSRAHNVITVDGEDQIRRNKGLGETPENVVSHLGDNFDYAESTYNEKFGELAGIDVSHKRKVAFDKDGILFVSDEVYGDGEHTVEQYWNTAMCNWKLEKNNRFVGEFDDNTGFIIIPLSNKDLESDVAVGQQEPLRGWNAPSPNYAEPTPSLRYSTKKSALPLTIDTIIVPYEGEMPEIKTAKIECKNNNSCVKISMPNGNTMWYLVKNGEKRSGNEEYGSFIFDGDMALITKDKSNKIIDVCKYPLDSNLTENNGEIQDISVNITSIKSGDIINTDNVKLSSSVTGTTEGVVEYYAKTATGEGLVATAKVGEEALWDISNVADQKNVSLWCEVKSGVNRRVSTKLKSIEIIKTMKATQKMELENREFLRSPNSVAMTDGKASLGVAVTLGKGDYVCGKINSESSSKMNLIAKFLPPDNGDNGQPDGAKLDVIINGKSSKINLTNAWKDYKLGDFSGDIEVKFVNNSNSLVMLDYLKFDGDNISKTNNKLLRNRLDISNDEVLFGDTKWTDYTLSAKVKIQNIYGNDGGCGLSVSASANAGYGVFYDGKSKKLQIREKTKEGRTALSDVDFQWDLKQWYNMEIKIQGETVYAKVWECGKDEPKEWTLTAQGLAIKDGLACIDSHKTDMLIDDIVVTDSAGKMLYQTDMEGSLNGDRPAGWTVTKGATWVTEDYKITR